MSRGGLPLFSFRPSFTISKSLYVITHKAVNCAAQEITHISHKLGSFLLQTADSRRYRTTTEHIVQHCFIEPLESKANYIESKEPRQVKPVLHITYRREKVVQLAAISYQHSTISYEQQVTSIDTVHNSEFFFTTLTNNGRSKRGLW